MAFVAVRYIPSLSESLIPIASRIIEYHCSLQYVRDNIFALAVLLYSILSSPAVPQACKYYFIALLLRTSFQ